MASDRVYWKLVWTDEPWNFTGLWGKLLAILRGVEEVRAYCRLSLREHRGGRWYGEGLVFSMDGSMVVQSRSRYGGPFGSYVPAEGVVPDGEVVSGGRLRWRRPELLVWVSLGEEDKFDYI